MPEAATPLVLNLPDALQIAYKYTKYLNKNNTGVTKNIGSKNDNAIEAA